MNTPAVSCTCNGTCHPELVENHALCECGHTRSSHRTVAAPLRAAKFGACLKLDADRNLCGCREFIEERGPEGR